MNRFPVILILLACGLSACAHRKPERVPANPPGSSAMQLSSTEDESAREQQLVLRRTINELRQEVSELRLLFKLKTAPLADEGADHEALSPTPVLVKSTAASKAQSATEAPVIASPPQGVSAGASDTAATAIKTYSTLFRFASATLDDQARASLAAIRPHLLQARQVELSAYADPSGQAALNGRLAQSRALVVKQELLHLGVQESRITVHTSVAESRPTQASIVLGLFKTPEALSRRVDLALLGRSAGQ